MITTEDRIGWVAMGPPNISRDVIANLKLKQKWSCFEENYFQVLFLEEEKNLQNSKWEIYHGTIRRLKRIQLSQGVEYHSGRVVRDVTGKIRRGQARQGFPEAPINLVDFILRAVGTVHRRVWSKGQNWSDLPISEQCQEELGDGWLWKPEDCSGGWWNGLDDRWRQPKLSWGEGECGERGWVDLRDI